MSYILVSVLALGAMALIASVVLYVCSRKFAVKADPRVAQILDLLPKANCGGCGMAGCQAMAEAMVKKADSGDGNFPYCPVGGDAVMKQAAAVLGVESVEQKPRVAVVRCAGCRLPKAVSYDGLRTCATMNACGAGETGCGYGCLGCGDCVAACSFGGIKINPSTGIPAVDDSMCTACGACAKACPRHLIELHNKGVKGRRVYVACSNRDKGPAAMKVCGTSCIGCGKCAKECPFGAIAIDGNVAHIDHEKCRLCRKCVAVCPRKAIVADGFPVKPFVNKTQEEK